MGGRGGLQTCADDDDSCSCEHPDATSEVVVDRARKENCRNRTDIVHSKDETGARASALPTIRVCQ